MISFIIPAYNEEHELPGSLAALHVAAKTAGQPYEIIVVDDASTDATAAIAKSAGAKVVPICRRQIAAARNAGAREASGDLFFFVDADTRIKATHIAEGWRRLNEGAAGGSARIVVEDEIPRWARISLYLFSKIYFGANLGAGAFLFTSRAFFDRTGGFDEQYFAGEEIYFSKALKRLGRFVLLHEPVTTSGRKLRIYSAGHIFRRTLQIVFGGKHAIRSRHKLDLWYDGRRETERS